MKEVNYMAKCEICGKGPQFGHNVSHALNRTKRRWLPNIQKVTIADARGTRRIRICRKCVRTLNRKLVVR